MNKIKEVFTDKSLYLFGIITLLFFGVFASMQYAPDTYFVFAQTTRAVVEQFFSCGRFVTGIAAIVFKGALDFSPQYIYMLSYIFALICTIVSLYRLYKLINKDIENKIICIILSTLTIINIFAFELFVYIEKGIMMFSVLMSILAVEQIDKLLQEKKWKYALIATLYMLVAICSYQGTIGIFVAISLIYIFKHSKTIKEFILNNIKVALIYGIPSIINFILVRFTTYNSRVAGNIVIRETIAKVIQGVKNLFINTYNLFPQYAFILIIFAIIAFTIYKLLRDKEENNKTKILKVLGIIYILCGTIFATIAPQVLQNTDSIWFVARSSYPAASVIGIMLIYIFSNFRITNTEKNIIIVTACIYMIVQFICFNIFAINNYIVNYEDKQIATKIINMIEDYEKQTGNTITKIAIYQDKYLTYTYQNVKTSGDINTRAFCTQWAANSIINYYSGRKLESIGANAQLQDYFKENDWKEFEEKQILFEKDTIHLCLY